MNKRFAFKLCMAGVATVMLGACGKEGSCRSDTRC